tara:strand:+ start:309 stop:893 length:585 start_codon:yes stop_codon:yes gene_type:complete
MKLLIFIITFFTNNSSENNLIIQEVNTYLNNKNITTEEILFISINKQKLYHIKLNKVLSSYYISSSKYGVGSKSGSNKTPLGLHKIKEKHGDKTPINGRMIGRIFYGEISTIYTDKTKSKTDDVTSRIFWLEGLEKGKNKGQGIDSYDRYIYIHGTSEEGMLGSPASHGCIRMSNKDVIDLYKIIEVGTLVVIL